MDTQRTESFEQNLMLKENQQQWWRFGQSLLISQAAFIEWKTVTRKRTINK